MSEVVHAIDVACRKLLAEHFKRPFHLLREASVQGRLAELIRQELGEKDGVCDAQLWTFAGKKWRDVIPRQMQRVSRVQMEMKIVARTQARDEAARWCKRLQKKDKPKERFDIVVLANGQPGHPVRLHVDSANGAGDVVATLAPVDVAAIVEVKASPLVRDDQRKAFDRDLEKLLELKKTHAHIAAFFVYLDKSMDLYGTVTGHAAFRKKLAEAYGNADGIYTPAVTGLTVSSDQRLHGDSFVHMYFLERNSPVRRYAGRGAS
jgi:hypothetical protein